MPRNLNSAADFADDGGTPDFRARQAALARARRSAPLWAIARILWLVPALVPLGAFFFGMIWFAAGIAFGPGRIPNGDLALFAALLALACLPRNALAGVPLALTRPTRPAVTRADGIAELVRVYVVSLYGCYALVFWAFAALLVWILWHAGIL
ncbi:MAG TPA: hypothetical protein VMF62_13450 [Acetobacteraceae bacterium]|nr:hypothetical protein [Acetobacteraceae bacterium]